MRASIETDQRVLSHPLNFLAEHCVAIEIVGLEVDMNGNNVRLVVPSARQASDISPGELARHSRAVISWITMRQCRTNGEISKRLGPLEVTGVYEAKRL